MRNYVSVADTINVPAPAGGAVGGTPYAIGRIAGIWSRDGAAAEVVPLLVEGIVSLTHSIALGVGVWVNDSTFALSGTSGAGKAYLGVSLGSNLIALGKGFAS